MSYLDSLFSVEGKAAIVTGGGHGIGKGLAEALLRAGATVVIAGRKADKLEETAAQFGKESLPILTCPCDVTDATERSNLVDYTLREIGSIDILVNNAGGNLTEDVLDYPDEYWFAQHELLLKGPFHLSQMAGRHMREKQGGSIINITSVGAQVTFAESPAYNAFKAGLEHLTRMMANDLAPHNIRVNCIAPGYVHSGMTRETWRDERSRKESLARIPLKRYGDPCDLAGALLLLASDAGAYITGQSIVVDGGLLIHR